MILNIYKPPGLTSYQVVAAVKRLTGERRVGHAGTLDPFAEGVLVVGVGRDSTRQLQRWLKNSQKEYEAVLELGKTSSTGDPEGIIKNVAGAKEIIKDIAKEEIKEALKRFTGEIWQTPPIYSAVKVKGRPAYKYARAGEKINLPKRKVFIKELKLEKWEPPFLSIYVKCYSGTYIRSLAEDIGKSLGTGAYLTKLVRTAVGDFKIKDAVSLETLRKAYGSM